MSRSEGYPRSFAANVLLDLGVVLFVLSDSVTLTSIKVYSKRRFDLIELMFDHSTCSGSFNACVVLLMASREGGRAGFEDGVEDRDVRSRR